MTTLASAGPHQVWSAEPRSSNRVPHAFVALRKGQSTTSTAGLFIACWKGRRIMLVLALAVLAAMAAPAQGELALIAMHLAIETLRCSRFALK